MGVAPTKIQDISQIIRSTTQAANAWMKIHNISELPLHQIDIDKMDLKRIDQKNIKSEAFHRIPATLSLNDEKKSSKATLRLSKDKFNIDVFLDEKVPLFMMHHFILR